MSFSPLANMELRIPDGGRWNPRQSAITGFGIHHNAGVDAWGQATAPNREVSANYWIANDGTILPNVDEERRAFTSGSAGYPAGAAADHRNVTVEVSNSPEGVRTGSWAISDAAMTSLIALIADVYARHGLGPVRRGAEQGVGIHQDWVPTACPGPYIVANLGGIIAEAERLRSGGSTPTPTPEPNWEDTVQTFKHKTTRKQKQVRMGGKMSYVRHTDDQGEKLGDANIARGPGVILSIGVSLTLSGDPGTRVATRLLVESTRDGKKRSRKVANPRMVIDSFGRDGVQLNFSGYLAADERLRLQVQPTTGKSVTVEEFYWDGTSIPGGR